MPTDTDARHPIRAARKDPVTWQVRAIGQVRLGAGKANARVQVMLKAGREEKTEEFPLESLAVMKVNSLWERGVRTHRAANFGKAKRYQVVVTGPGELVRPREHLSFFAQHYFLTPDAFFGMFLLRAKAVVMATGEPGLEQDRPCDIIIPTTTIVVDLLGQTGALLSALVSPAPDWDSSFWHRGSPSRPRTFFGPERGAVTVCLPSNMGEDEAVTAAYLFADDFAREEAKKIHCHHDRVDPSRRNIVMRLPFCGERRMEVVGICALTTPRARKTVSDPPPPQPDAYWALLVHQISFCDLGHPSLKIVHFDKVNDNSPSLEKAEGDLEERSGPPLIAPTSPEGKDLDTNATPRSGQKARGWDVVGHHPHFGRVAKDRLPKQAPTSEARPGDIPETGEFKSVALGPTSGRGTVPPLQLQAEEENEMWRDSLQALAQQPEYTFAVGLLLRLGTCGWAYAPLWKSDWIFRQQLREHSRREPNKVFAASLQHATGIAGLFFEFPHRDSGASRSQSGSLLARVAAENAGEIALAEVVAAERCAFKIARMTIEGWAFRALKHWWTGSSDEVAISRHAAKVSKTLRSITFVQDSIWQTM